MTHNKFLLSRDKFREAVFARDNHKCVFCDKPAKDAHHILERRLFPDGGYYLNNGASVCEEHHLKCESTEISVREIRDKCNIKLPVIPPHLYGDQEYDKWGNILLPNGTRLKGELFEDESVQKIIKPFLHLFSNYVKYPRSYHLPWSKSVNKDDRVLPDIKHFIGKEIIMSLKMDGENSSVYTDYYHARSLDSDNHESRNWAKNYCSRFQHDIPTGWRICFENLYAKHSIQYNELPSYINGFSVWNDKNVCLSWDETLEYFSIFGIEPVPVLYRGTFDEKIIRKIESELDFNTTEGYVIRLASEFHYKDFRFSLGKFVRANHIQDVVHHWKSKKVVKNNLKVN